MDKYGFCKIFVCVGDPGKVMDLLTSLLGGTFQRRSMAIPGLIVDVLGNPDRADGAEDFVRWPVLVEMEAQDPMGQAIVNAAARIVTALWEEGWPTVAACDFEDELPWRGGIGRLRSRQGKGLAG